MSIIINSILKKTLIHLKLFTLFFMICSSAYFIYNICNIEKLQNMYITTLNNVYSVARRFG